MKSLQKSDWKFPGLTIAESRELKRMLVDNGSRPCNERMRALLLKSMVYLEELGYREDK